MTEHNSHGQYFSIIPHWIIFSGVSSGAIHLFAVLAKYADYDTHEAFPSRQTLAKGIGKSTDTVDRHVKELQKIGALVVTRRKLPGTQGNQTNIYELIYAEPAQTDVAAPLRPGSEDDDGLAAPMPPGVAAPVSQASRNDAAQNDTHLTKPTLNKNPSLQEVPLRRGDQEISDGDFDEEIEVLPTASRRPLRSTDQKHRGDSETFDRLWKSLGRELEHRHRRSA